MSENRNDNESGAAWRDLIELIWPAMTRRDVLAAGAVGVVGLSLPVAAITQRPDERAEVPAVSVTLKVNGEPRTLSLDPRVTLLDALREHLALTGSKKGCDHGQCGACTVLVNGRRINGCLSLAVMHAGDEIATIEGLGHPGHMHPMQAAFVKHDGFQCGYCTPGQICSSVAVLEEIKRGVPSHVTQNLLDVSYSDTEVRERMSGNICRCAAYPNIIAAIRDVHEEERA
jgi:xanthine dehydrogenase YagT iron-sulfur-binding subunit